jgi:hypothetical protein
MKRILLIICILTLSLSCSNDEKAVSDLTVNPLILEFDNIESTQNIYIGSNTAWTISSDQEWCQPSMTGKYKDVPVEIRVQANTSYEERIAYISINNLEKTIIRTVKIIQKSLEPVNPENE